ncbi:MAG: diguanylate cyclase [Aquimonas sp.]|nr:diguanylate cyclase [Aquimonas sp.]
MRLSDFIRSKIETILVDWDAFAKTLDSGAQMDWTELRDHAREMLLAMAEDIERDQSPSEQAAKAKGEDADNGGNSWAKVHGRGRKVSGFDVNETVAEFRALRASVVLHWTKARGQIAGDDLEDLTRFHEAIDQAVAESLEQYSAAREMEIRLFEAVLRASPDPIYVLDRDGAYIYANKATSELLDLPTESIIGHTSAELGLPFADRLHAEHQQVVAHLCTRRGETAHVYPSGLERCFEYLLAPVLSVQGEFEAAVCVSRDISDRIRAGVEISHNAHHDLLTGLPNRRLLLDRLGQASRQAIRSHRMLAVLFLDLDGFKQVNDSFGHEAGDHLLIEVAARLKGCVRQEDTVARLGGDEFTVILAGVWQRQDVELVAHSIIAALAMPFPIAEQSAHISASIGCALFPEHGASPEALLRAADQAMFRAKKSASSRFLFHGTSEPIHNAAN